MKVIHVWKQGGDAVTERLDVPPEYPKTEKGAREYIKEILRDFNITEIHRYGKKAVKRKTVSIETVTKAEARERREYLAEKDKAVENRPAKSKRFNDVSCAVGYVDSNGAVHGKIYYQPEHGIITHSEAFPNAMRFKCWRWNHVNGLDSSVLNTVKVDSEDWEAVKNWLLKHGLLHDWEL